MSNKEQVLKVWPDAVAYRWDDDGLWTIIGEAVAIGDGWTEEQAWANAAEQIKMKENE